jgi:hypothetical protein
VSEVFNKSTLVTDVWPNANVQSNNDSVYQKKLKYMFEERSKIEETLGRAHKNSLGGTTKKKINELLGTQDLDQFYPQKKKRIEP